MNRLSSYLGVPVACIWALMAGAVSKAAEVVTFEGLRSVITPITDEIPGLLFRGEVYVFDPAEIGNSAGVPLSAATSGTAAASANSAMAVQFATPVTYVSANISPGFLTVANISAVARVDLIGYDVELNERARTIFPMQSALETAEQAQAFRPQQLS